MTNEFIHTIPISIKKYGKVNNILKRWVILDMDLLQMLNMFFLNPRFIKMVAQAKTLLSWDMILMTIFLFMIKNPYN